MGNVNKKQNINKHKESKINVEKKSPNSDPEGSKPETAMETESATNIHLDATKLVPFGGVGQRGR